MRGGTARERGRERGRGEGEERNRRYPDKPGSPTKGPVCLRSENNAVFSLSNRPFCPFVPIAGYPITLLLNWHVFLRFSSPQ